MNAMSKLLIIAIFAMSLVSCGGGGNSGTGTPIAVAPSETLAPEVDSNSYLPLSAGIETSFSDGPLSEDGSITVQGLKVQVTEDGVIKMSGRKVYSDGYADVEETLKCTEEGGAIFLTGSEIDASYSDGSSRANSRTYDPPVTILADKSSLSEGGVFETEHLAVAFDGDPDTINIWENGNISGGPIEITDLEDTTATVEVGGRVSLPINGRYVDVYLISFNWDIVNHGLWFPFGFLSNGRFGLAKGIGIVRIDARDANETNAIE